MYIKAIVDGLNTWMDGYSILRLSTQKSVFVVINKIQKIKYQIAFY